MTRAALCGRSFVAVVCTTLLVTSVDAQTEHKTGAVPQLKSKPGRWTAELGPARERSGAYATVPLPKSQLKIDAPYGAALSLTSGQAAVFFVDDRFGGGTKTRAVLCDVVRGQVSQQWIVNGIFRPLDLDPAGRRFLVRHSNGGRTNHATAEVWTVTADNRLTQQRWVPYQGEADNAREVLWAGFVGAERIVTLSGGGKLSTWDAATLRPLGWVQAAVATPAVSPNGKYLAFLRPDAQVGLLDPVAGEVLGLMPLGIRVKEAALAFRPDGRALACVSEDRVVLLDIPTGQVQLGVVAGVKGRTAGGSSAVGWVDERLLFINNYLVDPAVPVPLWSYHNLYWEQVGGGHAWFLASGKFNGDMALVPLKVPEPSIQARLANGRADVPPLLLQPGHAVQVDVSQLPREHQRDAQRILEERLRHYEYRPATSAPMKLVARLGKEGSRQTKFSGGKDGENVTTRVVRAEVVLARDGKEVWSQKIELTSGPPMFVLVKPGQSVSSQLAGSSIPDYDRLKRLELPKYLSGVPKGGRSPRHVGTTYVRPDGVR